MSESIHAFVSTCPHVCVHLYVCVYISGQWQKLTDALFPQDVMGCSVSRADWTKRRLLMMMMMMLAMAVLSSAISPCDLHLQGVD